MISKHVNKGSYNEKRPKAGNETITEENRKKLPSTILGRTLEGRKTVLKRQTEKKKNLCVSCKLAGILIILA